MLTDRYYYNRLADKEKLVYSGVYEGIVSMAAQVRLKHDVSMDGMQRIVEAINCDNPHLYYFNHRQVDVITRGATRTAALSYFCSMAERSSIDRQIAGVVNAMLSNLQIERVRDEYEREMLLHDALVQQVSYDYAALEGTDELRAASAHSIYGVFIKKQATCDGIAKAMKLLLNAANIHCIIVNGKAKMEGAAGHAWNIVRINSAPYHLDATWDIENSTPGSICYDYFNLCEADILRDHSDFQGVPVCSSREESYYAKSGLVFTDIRSAESYVRQRIRAQQMEIRMQFLSVKMDINDAVKQLVQAALSEVARDGYRWHASYSTNPEQHTLWISCSIIV